LEKLTPEMGIFLVIFERRGLMPQDPEKGISGLFLKRRRLRDEKEQEGGKMSGHHFLEKEMVV